jgi:hypothetical protein
MRACQYPKLRGACAGKNKTIETDHVGDGSSRLWYLVLLMLHLLNIDIFPKHGATF